MKHSNYNITVPFDVNRSIIFNSITKKFFICSNLNLNNFYSVINSPNKYLYDASYKNILTTLTDNGFIIEDDVNEIDDLVTAFRKNIEEKEYSLTIMTTYACNFSCWYCVQNHKPIYLKEDVEQKIINHIKLYVKEHDIKKLHISWFGGEPLLNFKSIRKISLLAKEYCASTGVYFSCSITTNGSLLNKSMIQEMKSLNFISYQITIDGSKENHNNTRFNNAINNSFDLLLNNIVNLVTIIPNALVTLRINYTRSNLSELLAKDINQILEPVKNKIYVLFRKVWQEPEDEQMSNLVSKLTYLFQKLGYIVEHDYDNFDLLSCYVEKRHYLSVYPDGTIDRCNNKDISKSRGYITDSGTVIWNESPRESLITAFSNNSECRECKYLPLCMGPCPLLREKMYDSVNCIIDEREKYFRRDIIEYCKIKSNFNL